MQELFADLIQNLDWSVPTWDLFILIFFVTGGVLYGFTLGKARIMFVLVSLYISLAITSNLPFLDESTSEKVKLGGSVSALKISVFALCIALLFFMFTRMGALSSFKGKMNPVHIMIFSLLHVGLLISIIISFLPKDIVENLAPFTKQVFASDMGKFLWLLIPLGAMILIKKKDEVK